MIVAESLVENACMRSEDLRGVSHTDFPLSSRFKAGHRAFLRRVIEMVNKPLAPAATLPVAEHCLQPLESLLVVCKPKEEVIHVELAKVLPSMTLDGLCPQLWPDAQVCNVSIIVSMFCFIFRW